MYYKDNDGNLNSKIMGQYLYGDISIINFVSFTRVLLGCVDSNFVQTYFLKTTDKNNIYNAIFKDGSGYILSAPTGYNQYNNDLTTNKILLLDDAIKYITSITPNNYRAITIESESITLMWDNKEIALVFKDKSAFIIHHIADQVYDIRPVFDKGCYFICESIDDILEYLRNAKQIK